MTYFNVNIEEELMQELRVVAKEEKRTVTAQINYYVEKGMYGDKIKRELDTEVKNE